MYSYIETIASWQSFSWEAILIDILPVRQVYNANNVTADELVLMLWAIGGKTYIYVLLLNLGTGEALAQDAHGLDGCFEETFKSTLLTSLVQLAMGWILFLQIFVQLRTNGWTTSFRNWGGPSDLPVVLCVLTVCTASQSDFNGPIERL